jgi:hypothetical protein
MCACVNSRESLACHHLASFLAPGTFLSEKKKMNNVMSRRNIEGANFIDISVTTNAAQQRSKTPLVRVCFFSTKWCAARADNDELVNEMCMCMTLLIRVQVYAVAPVKSRSHPQASC